MEKSLDKKVCCPDGRSEGSGRTELEVFPTELEGGLVDAFGRQLRFWLAILISSCDTNTILYGNLKVSCVHKHR